MTSTFPTAVQIVDWYHASERVWDLGRALYGLGTDQTAAWVEELVEELGIPRLAPKFATSFQVIGSSSLLTPSLLNRVCATIGNGKGRISQADRLLPNRRQSLSWPVSENRHLVITAVAIGTTKAGPVVAAGVC